MGGVVFSVTVDIESEEMCFSVSKDCSSEPLDSDIIAKYGDVWGSGEENSATETVVAVSLDRASYNKDPESSAFKMEVNSMCFFLLG